MKSRLFTILDLDDIEAMPFEVHSPLWYAVHAAGKGSEKEIDLPEGSAGGSLVMQARKAGPVEPLKVCAARRGFGSLDLSYLRQLAVHLGATDEITVVDIISELLKVILPADTPPDVFVAALENRMLSYEEQPDVYEDALNDDTILEAFDPKECSNQNIWAQCVLWARPP